MRVLVTWGSRLGGTAGIGLVIADALRARGIEVVEAAAARAPSPRGFDAVILGGALYANRWHADARRYAARHARELRRVPTWLFSSGPLDHSADQRELPPVRQVRTIMAQIGALGHRTFGGRLEPTVRWFPARAMTREHAGDWRDPDRIRAWAAAIADALPAQPRAPVELAGGSLVRLAEYGIVGWALVAVVFVLLVVTTRAPIALAAKVFVAPVWFGWLARNYQEADGARPPLAAAAAWTVLAAVLDGVIVAGALRFPALVLSIPAYWLPLALIFFASWTAGSVAAMLPPPQARGAAPRAVS